MKKNAKKLDKRVSVVVSLIIIHQFTIIIMKTIKVKATGSEHTYTELWYAYNSSWGVTCTRDQQDAEDSGQTVIKAIVTVACMYPGTRQGWDIHIMGCITDTLIREGLAVTDDGDIYII